jgi:phage terminase Nu1 subunit (DNA packaging protein)
MTPKPFAFASFSSAMSRSKEDVRAGPIVGDLDAAKILIRSVLGSADSRTMDRETAEVIKRHFDVVAEGLRSEMHDLAGGLRSEIHVVDEGLRSEMHDLAGGLRSEIRVVDEKVDRRFVDLKRHFDVVGESLRSDIRTVAEGFVSTNERLDRIESAMSERFGELEGMIRLSFGELARRIQ